MGPARAAFVTPSEHAAVCIKALFFGLSALRREPGFAVAPALCLPVAQAVSLARFPINAVNVVGADANEEGAGGNDYERIIAGAVQGVVCDPNHERTVKQCYCEQVKALHGEHPFAADVVTATNGGMFALRVFNGDGWVTGSREREESLAQAFNNDKTYRFTYSSGGQGPFLEFTHNTRWERLAAGMMDWWQKSVVPATPQNLSTVHAAGMVQEDKCDWPANSPWRED